MNFYRDDLTPEEFRGGLISAAIGLSIVVPVGVTLLLPRASHLRAGYLNAAFSAVGAVGAYVVAHLMALGRSGFTRLNPTTTFVLVVLLEVGIALLDVAAGGPIGLYQSVLVLNAIFVGIIGDLVMQASFWAVALVLISWSSWATGLRGGTLVTVVAVAAAVMAASQAMIGTTIRSYSQFGHSTSILDDMTDVAIASDTFEQGLGQAMALLPEAFPCGHVTVFVRSVGEENWNIVAAWPSRRPEDEALSRFPGFVEAVDSFNAVVTRDHCFIPVGFTGAGELTVALDRDARKWKGDPFSLEMTGAMAAGLLRVASQIDQVDLLRATSRTDALTGLANRRVLTERAETEMARSRRSGAPLSVAILDIDHFKAYNDEFGHLAGDQVLASISLLMADRLRGQDLLVRYGGEEFCTLLPDVDAIGGRVVVDELRALARTTPSHTVVTISGGVAQWDGAESFEALLERADQALYTAKRSGRDRTVVANPHEAEPI